MYGGESPTSPSSSQNNRVEPSFFHTSNSQHNPTKKPSQAPAENPYWQASPPPYSLHPNTGDAPSAPPLDIGQPQIYPPVGYNQPNYGSTADSPPSWPWVTPPSNPSPSRNLRWCDLFWYCFIGFVFVCGLSQIFFPSTPSLQCTGVHWQELPPRFEFDSRLKITGNKGITTGRILIRDATETIQPGTVILKGMISDSAIGKVHYTLSRTADETHLDIHVSRESFRQWCVSLEAVIYVSPETQWVHVDLPNMAIEIPEGLASVQTLQLSTSNSPIVFNSPWRGKNLMLNTSNAHIQLLQPIFAEESVVLTASNGAVTGQSRLEAKKSISVVTSNAPIHLNNIKTGQANIITSNGAIVLDHSVIGASLVAHTSNNELTAHIQSETSHPNVVAKTSNGRASVYMSENFEGSFVIATSSYNDIAFVDELGWSKIKVATKSFIMGDRYELLTSSDDPGSLKVETSNSDAKVLFISK